MGAEIYITARRKDKLSETLSLIGNSTNHFFAADLTTEDGREYIANNVPKLDGVVHCAGIGFARLCKQIAEKDIDYVMDINFKAPVLLQSLLLSKKKVNKAASIVFIASNGYNTPIIGNSIYSASKGALISYANCLKLELANRLIRVNCICPGMVWTDLIEHDGITKEELKKDEQNYLFKRYGQPQDIANFTIYLLSDASSWMTGQNIEISGGAPKL